MSPILLLFPLVTEMGRKVQFAVPLIPKPLLPFVGLMCAHWSGPGPRTDRTKILSLRFCNYVRLASYYCFAHIIWRTGSITMQKSLRQQRKIDAMEKQHKWRRWSPVDCEAPPGKQGKSLTKYPKKFMTNAILQTFFIVSTMDVMNIYSSEDNSVNPQNC